MIKKVAPICLCIFLFLQMLKQPLVLFIPSTLVDSAGLLCLVFALVFSSRRFPRSRNWLTLIICALVSFFFLLLSLFLQVAFGTRVTSPQTAILSFVQFALPLAFLVLTMFLDDLQRAVFFRTVYRFFIVVFGVALVEIFVPWDIKGLIITVVRLSWDIPNDYKLWIGPLVLMRSASIVFVPLTFGLLAAIAVVQVWFGAQRFSRRIKVLALLVLALTLVRSALIIFLLVFIVRVMKRLWQPILLAYALATLALFAYAAVVVETVSYGTTNESVHFSGFANGVRSMLEKPFGNGLGTSGYTVGLLVAKDASLLDPFQDINHTRNGNESAIGVILYQFGLFGSVVYFLPFLGALLIFFRQKKIEMAFLVLAVFFSMITSESLISVTVLSFFWSVVVLNINDARLGVGRRAQMASTSEVQ